MAAVEPVRVSLLPSWQGGVSLCYHKGNDSRREMSGGCPDLRKKMAFPERGFSRVPRKVLAAVPHGGPFPYPLSPRFADQNR